jgi:hypothetical protein
MTTGFQAVPEQVRPGDRLVVRAHRQGEPERDAEILAVLGKHGEPPYHVRWTDDGHETVVYPGSDVYVAHVHGRRSRSTPRSAVADSDSSMEAPAVPASGS